MTEDMKDVAVIGVGSIGSMVAWQLAKEGISVIGFEQFGRGHDRAGAGGESRLFRMIYKEKAAYVPLLKKSLELWKELEQASGDSLITQTGGLTIGRDNSDTIQNAKYSLNYFQLNGHVMSTPEVINQYPQHRIHPEDTVVWDQDAGFIKPELSVVKAWEQAEKYGAELLTYCPVTHIEQTEQCSIIHVADGREFKARHLIFTAGAWTNQLISAFRSHLKVKRIHLTWFTPKNTSWFTEKNFPIFTRSTETDRFFGAPSIDGVTVKIGSSRPGNEISHADHLDRTVNLEEIHESSAIAQNYFRGLYPDPIRSGAYMDGYTEDGQSIIGSIPGWKNAIILTGFSGHGFKMAPAFGMIAKDLIVHGKVKWDLTHIDSQRFSDKTHS